MRGLTVVNASQAPSMRFDEIHPGMHKLGIPRFQKSKH